MMRANSYLEFLDKDSMLIILFPAIVFIFMDLFNTMAINVLMILNNITELSSIQQFLYSPFKSIILVYLYFFITTKLFDNIHGDTTTKKDAYLLFTGIALEYIIGLTIVIYNINTIVRLKEMIL